MRGGRGLQDTVPAFQRCSWSMLQVSMYQYESKDEVTAHDSPTNPLYPYTLNFVPCTNGDNGTKAI